MLLLMVLGMVGKVGELLYKMKITITFGKVQQIYQLVLTNILLLILVKLITGRAGESLEMRL